MNNSYVVNGKTYTSLEEMPPDVRAQFEAVSNVLADQNRNGVPDLVENMMGTTAGTVGTTIVQTNTIVFDGKTYTSVDDMPPEGRAAYEKAMGKLADENHDGVPDVLENAFKNMPPVTSVQVNGGSPRLTLQSPGTSNMGPVIVLSIVILGLVVVIGLLLVLVLTKTGH